MQFYDCILATYRVLTKNEPTGEQIGSLNHLIEAIRLSDAELAKNLAEVKHKLEAYQFVKQDIELRSKVKEIWTFQIERTKKELLQATETYNLAAKQKSLFEVEAEDLL